jgi:hypothetical protein
VHVWGLDGESEKKDVCARAEAANGKNPLYHVGKLYNVAANRNAARLHEATGANAEVHLISATGQRLDRPWRILIRLPRTAAHSPTTSCDPCSWRRWTASRNSPKKSLAALECCSRDDARTCHKGLPGPVDHSGTPVVMNAWFDHERYRHETAALNHWEPVNGRIIRVRDDERALACLELVGGVPGGRARRGR